MNLQDKVIVITGGTKGIGSALAVLLKAEGARVAELIIETLQNKDNAEVKARIKSEIMSLAGSHPIPERFV